MVPENQQEFKEQPVWVGEACVGKGSADMNALLTAGGTIHAKID